MHTLSFFVNLSLPTYTPFLSYPSVTTHQLALCGARNTLFSRLMNELGSAHLSTGCNRNIKDL